MVAFMVAAWYATSRAQSQPIWGVLAAACALLAFFTKAAAVFFVAALGVDALLLFLWPPCRAATGGRRRRWRRSPVWPYVALSRSRSSSIPNWTDYRFYNWQISVTRKPSYDIAVAPQSRHVVSDRPRHLHAHVVHGRGGRVWLFSVRRRAGDRCRPPERLLALWVGLGAFELVVARRRQRAPVHLLHPGTRGADCNRDWARSASVTGGGRDTCPAPAALMALPLVALRCATS